MSDVVERINRGEFVGGVYEVVGDGGITPNFKATAELLRLAKLGQQMQWVNVNDLLPDKDDDVLVWVGTTSVRACIGKTPYGRAWYLVDKNCYLNFWNVTHWMPLPPNPNEAE